MYPYTLLPVCKPKRPVHSYDITGICEKQREYIHVAIACPKVCQQLIGIGIELEKYMWIFVELFELFRLVPWN